MRSSEEITAFIGQIIAVPDHDITLDIAEHLLNVFLEWDWPLHSPRHAEHTQQVIRDVTDWCLDENVPTDRVVKWLPHSRNGQER